MRNEQTEIINGLVKDINFELILGDYKDLNEMIDHTVSKAKIVAEDAENWAYTEARDVAEDIALRVGRLKSTKKAHKVTDRIKEIITTVKY